MQRHTVPASRHSPFEVKGTVPRVSASSTLFFHEYPVTYAMPTVNDLRARAKAEGVKGYSKMRKTDLEAALAAVGVDITTIESPPRPRSTRASPVIAQSPVRIELAVLHVVTVATGTTTSYVIPLSEIGDMAALEAELALPAAVRSTLLPNLLECAISRWHGTKGAYKLGLFEVFAYTNVVLQ